MEYDDKNTQEVGPNLNIKMGPSRVFKIDLFGRLSKNEPKRIDVCWSCLIYRALIHSAFQRERRPLEDGGMSECFSI